MSSSPSIPSTIPTTVPPDVSTIPPSTTTPSTSISPATTTMASVSTSPPPSSSPTTTPSSIADSPSTTATQPPSSMSSVSTISSTSDPPPSIDSSSSSSTSAAPSTTVPPPPTSTSSSSSSSTTAPPPPTTTSTTQPPPPSSTSTTVPPPSSTTTTPAPPVTTTVTTAGDEPVTATTTQEGVVTTLQSTVYITFTDSAGETITSAPPEITSLSTSTQSNGGVVTVTHIGVNPTLSPNNDSGDGSSFFDNTGAVAGVFVLVGLAVASILLWIFFALRRRRRTKRLEHDSAVSATLAAAGFHRAPLDDDEDDRHPTLPTPEMTQHSPRSSIPSGGRLSSYLNDVNIEGGFNPYTDPGMVAGPSREGFNAVNAYNGSEQKISHSASHSAGSYEPLLASFYQSHPNEAAQPPTPPPRNPQRIIEKSPIIPAAAVAEQRSSAGSTYSISSGDERLDPDLRRRMNEDANSFKGDLRDDEDYSRPVLGVRNIPDDASVLSH